MLKENEFLCKFIIVYIMHVVKTYIAGNLTKFEELFSKKCINPLLFG